MPEPGWKLVRYSAAVGEAAEWKRAFFKSRAFSSVDELIAAAAGGEDAKHYVEAFLALGHNSRKKRTVTDLVQAGAGERKGN
jgi:hypothetical protein